MKNRVLLTIAILTALGPTPAWAPAVVSAQNVKITTPGPMREPRIVTPGLLYERRTSEDLYYLGIPPSVPYDPAFVQPFVLQVETQDTTGRIGLSGWTSPNPPIGSSGTGWPEINGWLSFGLAWTWGGPPPARRSGAPDEPSSTSKP
jgi:hypothetical protein